MPSSKSKAKTKAKSKTKRKVGRPSCIENEQTRQDILDGVRLGMPFEWAAMAAGIDESTFYNLQNRGEADLSDGLDTIYTAFLKDLKKAKAAGMRSRLRTVDIASREQWQAAAWGLERGNPELFGRNRTVEVKDGERTITVEWEA